MHGRSHDLNLSVAISPQRITARAVPRKDALAARHAEVAA